MIHKSDSKKNAFSKMNFIMLLVTRMKELLYKD